MGEKQASDSVDMPIFPSLPPLSCIEESWAGGKKRLSDIELRADLAAYISFPSENALHVFIAHGPIRLV